MDVAYQTVGQCSHDAIPKMDPSRNTSNESRAVSQETRDETGALRGSPTVDAPGVRCLSTPSGAIIAVAPLAETLTEDELAGAANDFSSTEDRT